MGFPTLETVKLFLAELKKSKDIESIFDSYKDDGLNPKYLPSLSLLKEIVLTLNTREQYMSEVSPFFTGFMCAFDLFRRQIESEDMTVDDIEANLTSITNWTKFLEDENCRLKQELEALKNGNSK